MRSLRLVILLLAAVAAFAQPVVISDNGIVNGASFVQGQAIAPGSLVSIFGTGLASQVAAADSIPLATTLGGVSVSFVNGSNTFAAPMLYAQPGDAAQLNVQVPWDVVPQGSSATVNVIVTRSGVSSSAAAVTVGPFSPAIFPSAGRAVAVNQDGSLAWPAGAVSGVNSHPAKAGDILTLYATGLGAVDSPILSGHNSLDKLRHTMVVPTVLIGGISAHVDFSGLSPEFVGVNQLNIVVPDAAPGDSVPLQIQMGGITSPASLTIAVTR